MKPEDGLTRSIWADVRPTLPANAPDVSDVIVIGAGIAGVTVAYLLAGEGKRVTIVDEGPVGRGQTERTSAHLASIIDDRFHELEKMRGLDVAKLAYQSHSGAIGLIEKIAGDEQIDCAFERVDAYLFAGEEPTDVTLADEYAAGQRVGVAGLAWADLPPGVNGGRAIRYGQQAIFHPSQYLAGLATAAGRRGVRFVTGQRAIDATGKTDDAPPTVTLADDTKLVAQEAIVVCTNTPTPINDWVSIYLKQAAYRSYMVGHVIEDGAVPNALYWDTHDPYHYSRLTKQGRKTFLITGGEDHKVGQTGASEDRFAELDAWVRKTFPAVGELVYRWSGQVQEPSDGLGVIGVAPTKGENVYVITGDSGMGLTHGTLGAQLITDLITGRPNPYTGVYDPKRSLLNSDAIMEDLNTNLQYLDYLTGGDIKSVDDLAPGTGGLMRSGLSKIAVFKDDDGTVHQCSAVCPHLKAIVQWNPVEKTLGLPGARQPVHVYGRVADGAEHGRFAARRLIFSPHFPAGTIH